LRWLLPLGLVAALAVALTVGPAIAGTAPSLPNRSAAQLLASLAGVDQRPFSGTVVETSRLGLPALPDRGTGGGTSLQSLVTGSHSAQVWYASPQQVRVALTGDLAETDVIRNGADLWQWTSSTNTAEHRTLPTDATKKAMPTTGTVTPQQAAQQALAAVDPSTKVSVDGTARVAGRAAYELVLRPRDSRSLIGQVRLAIDGKTSTPLRVQVYATGGGRPAFETGFTSVKFVRPAGSVFRFRPPVGAKVKQLGAIAGPGESSTTRRQAPSSAKATATAKGKGIGDAKAKAKAIAESTGRPTVVGSGWTAVLVLRGVDLSGAASSPQLSTVLGAATPVQGSFGSGRLLRTKLVTALALDDGRLLVGAVTPQLLEQVATQPAAAVKAPAGPAHR
jgi:outer membrane lipoprotein-sorting protein